MRNSLLINSLLVLVFTSGSGWPLEVWAQEAADSKKDGTKKQAEYPSRVSIKIEKERGGEAQTLVPLRIEMKERATGQILRLPQGTYEFRPGTYEVALFRKLPEAEKPSPNYQIMKSTLKVQSGEQVLVRYPAPEKREKAEGGSFLGLGLWGNYGDGYDLPRLTEITPSELERSNYQTKEKSGESGQRNQFSESGNQEKRKNVIGFGALGVDRDYKLRYADQSTEEFTDSHSGGSLFVRHAPYSHFAMDIFAFSASANASDQEVTVSGAKAHAWLGYNFLQPGWNFAIGLAGVGEYWDFKKESNSNSSGGIGLLVGYNLERWVLEAHLTSYGNDDQQEDFSERSDVDDSSGTEIVDYFHSSYGVDIGYRF